MYGIEVDDLIIELIVEDNNVVYDGGTEFARLGLYPGLRNPDMGGQCYNGQIIMKEEVDGENVSYFFYYHIISDKRIELKKGTCPL